MAYDKFLIAPLKSGLITNTKSWQIMDDAFEYLQNAYIFRGRLRKRFGTQLMGPTPLNSRLRATLFAGGPGVGITDVTGAAAGNVTVILGDATLPLSAGQSFSVGGAIYTIISDLPGAQLMLATQGGGTFDVATGAFTIVGAPALTPVIFYPSFPVMGIDQYEIGAINNHPTYAFDTRYAYTFTGGVWNRSGIAQWFGTNQNYFWATTWQGLAGTQAFFVTNFHVTNPNGVGTATDDPMWYTLDGANWVPLDGVNAFYFLPNGGLIHTGPFVQTARIIVAFKNRLVLLNTIENNNAGGLGTNTQYKNRCRYSFNGSPFARNAWYEPNQSDSSGGVVNNNNIAAGAGFIDATTEEAIISAEFIKDRLIVYFERSTWELVYTQNEILPFVWQKLNTELGSQSLLSTIPFDKDVLTIGNTGVHACNGSNVRRIDEKIPDQIFEFEAKNNAPNRTVGIRDYYTETVYWAYVSDFEQSTSVFPNQILVYNYANDTWAINDDCFTAFGYFEQQSDLTWLSSFPVTWERVNGTWISNVLQANQRQILAGTPEGFVLKINVEETRNAPSMSITDMVFGIDGVITLTIISHNLDADPTENDYDQDFILIENVVGDAPTQNFLNGTIFEVDDVIDANTITIDTEGGLVAGTYLGGGTAARVSNIQLRSKNFNPYVDKDLNVYVAKADFAVEKTKAGAITVDYYTAYAPISMIEAGVQSTAIFGNNVLETFPYDPALYPFEQFQELLWHPIAFQSSGEFIQLVMYFSRGQMLDPEVALSAFEIQGICLYTQPVGRLQ